jgi:predicted metalloprotease with PDZ domain
MKKILAYIITLFVPAAFATARHSARDTAILKEGLAANLKESVWYVLKVDTGNLSGYEVEMFIHNPPHIFQVAMATHHEYDDRFWRYVENFRVESGSSFTRQDSAVWQVSIPGKDAIIRYRIHLPVQTATQRASHRPFLTAHGGLVGDLHSFMYIVGQTSISSHVTFELPAGWQIATGLESTNDSTTFYAPDAKFLMDCPVLVGQFWNGYFSIEGVPHRVVYWPRSRASSFDTVLLTKTINRIVQQVVNLFDTIPYRDYTFLLQDGAFGALEHLNSVTIGAPDSILATNMESLNGEIAHEFFHTWNLMRIKPIEYSDLNYGPQEQSPGLWWSEGLTMFYADLLLRRAGLPAYDSTRISHLEQLITRYFGSPGNTRFSPEQVSLASNKPIGSLGDYSASVHLQGELIGAMLDLIIRGATNGQNSIDDVMRKMFDRYGINGFSRNDIEQTVTDICKCNVHGFFDDYVRGKKIMDFNKYLEIVGLNLSLSWVDAINADGKPAPDMRVYSWQPEDGTTRLGITDPLSCWGKAGLHTYDKIIAVNGLPIKNSRDFRAILSGFHIGDNLLIEIQRPAGKLQTSVTIMGYKQPHPVIKKIKGTTELQHKLFDQWLARDN